MAEKINGLDLFPFKNLCFQPINESLGGWVSQDLLGNYPAQYIHPWGCHFLFLGGGLPFCTIGVGSGDWLHGGDKIERIMKPSGFLVCNNRNHIQLMEDIFPYEIWGSHSGLYMIWLELHADLNSLSCGLSNMHCTFALTIKEGI